MKKQSWTKKIVVLPFVFICFFCEAQIPKDSLIMTVGKKEISLAEFEFIAKKNNAVDFSNEKSLNEYIELFKNFKLKVAEAEELGIDKTPNFNAELETYKAQLEAGYLFDKNAEEAAAKVIYDRGSEYLVMSKITFPLGEKCLPKDTVEVYQQAMEVYNRILKGEDFDKVGNELYHTYLHHTHAHNHEGEGEHDHEHDDDCIHATFEYISCFLPMEYTKVLEETAYSMNIGDISKPIRTQTGFNLIKIHDRKPNPGLIYTAHLLIPIVPIENDPTFLTKEEALKVAEDFYKKASAGEDLLSLIEASTYKGKPGNGVLPVIPGQLIKEIEDAVYSLTTEGETAKPVLTNSGYHIIQLKERKGRTPFEIEKSRLIQAMERTDRNFELYRGFDERLKKEYGYTFYPEAYAELEKLCEEDFPNTNEFFTKARPMEKVLVQINGIDFPQVEFAYYMNSYGTSAKTYAGDYMKEVFDLFVRDIVTTLEKENLEIKHPEIPYLCQEYRDGMLLFEISNKMIWDKPIEDQAAVEEQWIKELNKKYPTTINWKLLKKLKNN